MYFFYAPPRRFNDYRGGTVFGGMRRVDVPGMRPGGPGQPGPGINGPINGRPDDHQDQTYSFTQKSEMLGFNNQVFTPSSKPDLRPDTVWHDSIHYDSIIMRGYTHFYPDDIVLVAFNEKLTDRYLLKSERPNLRGFWVMLFLEPS